MSCLLYCVGRGGLCQESDTPCGVQSQPVFLVSGNGLSAVVSELLESDSPPDVETVLAYEKVVEYYFGRATVVPMRYGCFARESSDVAALLARHREAYDALLQQLEGFVEMGVEVLSGESAGTNSTDPQPASPNGACDADKSGAAYLSGRKAHYCASDRTAGQQNEVIESLCGALAGTFARHKVERPVAGSRLLSVYFLVPRARAAHFRDVTRESCTEGHTKLLLSGPWPPYNFADLPSESLIS